MVYIRAHNMQLASDICKRLAKLSGQKGNRLFLYVQSVHRQHKSASPTSLGKVSLDNH